MSPVPFRRGFKIQAERLALKVRSEMGLAPHHRLDPRFLADHLQTRVVSLSFLVSHGASPESVLHLQTAGQSDFSAVTVFRESRRIIIVNEAHTEVRQASSLAHELSHLLLQHPPHHAVADNGCRLSFGEMEKEANYLAGVLLAPRDGVLFAVREGLSVLEAAAHFGVSAQMMQWRFNDTGAIRQARYERARATSVEARRLARVGERKY